MATIRPFQVNNGLEVNLNANVVGTVSAAEFIGNVQAPSVPSTLYFDFARGQALDSRITFARSSNAFYQAANGILVRVGNNVPRIDFQNGVCRGLLVEKAIPNMLLFSTNIGNNSVGMWNVGGGIPGAQAVTLNAATAPDGSNTATLFAHTNANVSYKSLSADLSIINNIPYTHSIFVKNAGEDAFTFVHYDGTDLINTISFTYNFLTNSFTAVSTGGSANCAVINGPRSEQYANGWTRVWYTYHYTSGGSAARYVSHKMDLNYGTAVAGRGILCWGAQLEWNDKPSTLVETTTSSATRAAEFAYVSDELANNFSSWYNPREGTIKVEWDVNETGSANNTFAGLYSGYPGPYTIWNTNDPNNVSSHLFYFDVVASKVVIVEKIRNSVNELFLATSIGVVRNTPLKSVVGYSNTLYSIGQTGTVTTGTPSTNVLPTVNRLELGRSRASWLDGHVRTFAYWPRKLSDTDVRYLSVT